MGLTVTGEPELTFAKLEKEVRRLAAEHPDFTYPKAPVSPDNVNSCWYVETNGLPRCIFGEALHNLGVSDKFLKDNEGLQIGLLLDKLSVGRTEPQKSWAFQVQRSQDDQISWGEAVRVADNRVQAAFSS